MSPRRLPERVVADDALVIRRWDSNDADVMATLIAQNLDHLRPWMAWARTEPLPAEARLRLFERWDRYWESGTGAVYAIEVADEVVGGCSLHRRVGPGGLDLGYWLGRHSTGQGIATRTAAALTEASFTLDDVDVVQISHTPSNSASGAVAARLGYVDVTIESDTGVTTWQRRRELDER